MSLELPPIVQRFMVDTAGYERGMGRVADILRGFQSSGEQASQGLSALREQLDRVAGVAQQQAEAARSVDRATRDAVRSMEVEWSRLARAIDGPLQATREQVAAVKQLMALGSQMGSSRLAEGLSRSIGGYAPSVRSPATEAQYRFANQSALEAMVDRMFPGATGRLPIDFTGGPGRVGRIDPGFGPANWDNGQAARLARLAGTISDPNYGTAYGSAKEMADRLMAAQRKRGSYDLMMSTQAEAAYEAQQAAIQTRAGKLSWYDAMMGRVNAGGRVSPIPAGFDSGMPAQTRAERLAAYDAMMGRIGAGGRVSRVPPGMEKLLDLERGGTGGMDKFLTVEEPSKTGGMDQFVKKFTSAFFIYHQFQAAVTGVVEAVTGYTKASIEAHGQMATSLTAGLHTAVGGFVTGIGKAFDSAVGGLEQSLRGLMEGGHVGDQVRALSHTVGGVLSGLEAGISGAVRGATDVAGGYVGATIRKMIGGYQSMAGVGQVAGSGVSAVGTGLLFSGVAAPVGIGLIAGGALVSAGSTAAGGILSAQAGAVGDILGGIVQAVGGLVGQIVQQLAAGLNQILALSASVVSSLIQAGFESQKMATAFDVLTKGRGTGMYGDIQGMTIVTPYTLGQLNSAAQTLLGMGVSAEALVGTMSMLGDVALGDEHRLQRLATVYGEVLAEGKMTGWRIRQLASVGVGVEDMAKTMGITGFDFRTRMAHNLVPADILRQTLVQMTGPGGRMAGMMDAVLNTPGGRFQQMIGTAGVATQRAGVAFNQSAGLADMFQGGTGWITKNMQTMVDLARQAGTYVKAMADEFINLGQAVAGALASINIDGKLFGIDWGDPVKMARQFTDALLGAAEAAGKVVGVLGKVVEALLTNLPAAIRSINLSLAEGLLNILKPGVTTKLGLDPLSKFLTDDQRVGLMHMVVGAQQSVRQWAIGLEGNPGLQAAASWFGGLGGNIQGVVDNVRGRTDAGRMPGEGIRAALPFLLGAFGSGASAAGTKLTERRLGLDLSDTFGNSVSQMFGNLALAGGGLLSIIPPKKPEPPAPTWRQFQSGTLSLMEGYRKLGGEDNILDRLTPAAARGSTDAYEAFARSFAAELEPRDVKGQIDKALGIMEQQKEFERRTMEEIMKLPNAMRMKVFGDVLAADMMAEGF